MRWLDGITDSMDIKFEQTLGDSEGQGSPLCCNPWPHKEADMTKRLNNNRVIMLNTFLTQKRPPKPDP